MMMRTVRQRAGPWLIAGVFIISFLTLVLAGIYSVDRQRAIDAKICLVTVENRDGTRRTWLAAQTLVLRANPNNPDAAVRTREFFQAILRSIPPIKCVDRKPIEIVQ